MAIIDNDKDSMRAACNVCIDYSKYSFAPEWLSNQFMESIYTSLSQLEEQWASISETALNYAARDDDIENISQPQTIEVDTIPTASNQMTNENE